MLLQRFNSLNLNFRFLIFLIAIQRRSDIISLEKVLQNAVIISILLTISVVG
jgi:hypothetical protein